jgi:hypothetical protein
MKGRNIMNGVLALHEILHETKRRKEKGIILKLDFEKAYDKVNWEFLFNCLEIRGFSDTWCEWIKKVVSRGTVCIKVNNKMGPYFVADCLARMIRQAQEAGLLIGLANNLIPNGVATLQYADDTIICLKEDLKISRNMKLLLYLYELMSGLKINFSKSEVVVINGNDELHDKYSELFNCQIGIFPLKYLGVPVSPGRLRVKDWNTLVEKNKKKLAIWKGGSMSIAGRLTLINSSLSSAFIYHMPMYLLPQTITQQLDKQRRTFFWQGGGTKRKYHLVKWEVICKNKKKGGVGVKDIRKMNLSLLCKW